MRERLLYIGILILVAIAAFEGGYVLGHHDRDDTKAQIQKLNGWIIDHGGRIEALETVDRRQKTGSGKPFNSPAGKEKN